MAHRLALVGKHAFAEFPYLGSIDKDINSLYTFYHSGGQHKRIAHMKKTIFDEHDKDFNLKLMHATRWVEARFKTLRTIMRHWHVIVLDLDAISQDGSFKPNARAAAESKYSIFTNRVWLSTMAYVLDICSILDGLSQELQKETGNLIGKFDKVKQLIANLEYLKVNNGMTLRHLLEDSVCENAEGEQYQCTLAAFEDTDTIAKYKDVELKLQLHDLENKLSAFRTDYINALLTQIKLYFVENDMYVYDIFNPKRLPLVGTTWNDYGKKEIEELCKRFSLGVPTPQIYNSFTKIIESVVSHAEFPSKRDLDPEEFWPYFMNIPIDMEWEPETLQLMRNILVIPAGTATA